jgi:hypothetical protein
LQERREIREEERKAEM